MSATQPVLKDPALSAVLAWLIPGLGHFYQGRIAKGVLFSVCLLSTFGYGMYLGDGGVVYLRWDQTEQRWAYLCQVGIGLPALPALVQSWRSARGWQPILGGFEAPPSDAELNRLNGRLGRFFDLGTVYTMIAGLLNVLAVYDAYAGPAIVREEREGSGGEEPDVETASEMAGAKQGA
ncbi:MAG: DUF6677 family protein [Pirellulales bacterium]